MTETASKNVMDIQYPVLNHEESIANISLNTIEINNEDTTINIQSVLDVHRNNLFLIIYNKGSVSTVTIKAGDAYPNSMLGDTIIELAPGYSAINLADLPRFVKADSSIDIHFGNDFKGTIFAIGKYKFKENDRVDW